jgi:hypothetical protein
MKSSYVYAYAGSALPTSSLTLKKSDYTDCRVDERQLKKGEKTTVNCYIHKSNKKTKRTYRWAKIV